MAEHTIRLSTGTMPYTAIGAGRALLYLHPLGGVRVSPVIEGLARSREVIVPVMPGFDGTPIHPEVASGEALARLMGEFVERVIDGPCDVLGHSFGAWVALWLAALRPECIDHLVLEAPAGLRPADAPPPPAPEDFARALYLHPEKNTAAAKPPEIQAGNERMRAHYGLPARADPALLPKLVAIRQTTLIVAGTHDRITPKESVQALKSRLASAYLIYVWDAAHVIEIDQPVRMLRLVESFLERSEAFLVNWGTAAANPD